MRKFCYLFLLLAIWAAPSFAQLEYADAKTKAECAQYAQTPLPAEATLVSAPTKWPDCDSNKLYFGIGTQVDLDAARNCAWQERSAAKAGLSPRESGDTILRGAAMLTVLYANGDGLEQNIPLAVRFACEAGGAPAEISGRVEHLESLAKEPAAANKKFGFCDDITSGMMDAVCEGSAAELADQHRSDAFNSLSANWPEPQRSAFAILEQAQQAYAQSHGGEIDAQGTSRAAQLIRAQQSLRDSFLSAIKTFENGSLPNHTFAEAKQEDAALNEAYRKAINDAEAAKSKYGSVKPENIQAAERAWLTYRDAWISFAKLRYPTVSTDSWLALLTKDRIATLQGGPCETDPDYSQCERQDTHAPRPLP